MMAGFVHGKGVLDATGMPDEGGLHRLLKSRAWLS